VDEELRAELLRRVKVDQAARLGDDLYRAGAVDAVNLPWLRRVSEERGWPVAALVGEDGAHAAWLLAQHADRDPAFQRRCLDLMTEAVAADQARRQDLAYLTDRVLLAEGQEQGYGTQVTRRGGEYQPRKLRDPDGVDQRRAAVGLEALADYLGWFADDPGPGAQLLCPGCREWVPFEAPEPGESFTVSCPGCGQETTGTFTRSPGPPASGPGT
jgi:hypothetical protein